MKRRNFITALIALLMFFTGSLFSQQETETEKVNLLNYEELERYLTLDIEQEEIIEPLVTEIKSIIDQDEKTVQGMRSKMQSMGLRDPSLREKMMRERNERQNKIDQTIEEIKNVLSEEQLEKFHSIEKPNLFSRKMGRSRR